MRRYALLKIEQSSEKRVALSKRVAQLAPEKTLKRRGKSIPLREGFFYNVTTGLHGDQFDNNPQSPTYGQIKGNDNGDFFQWKDELLTKKHKGRLAGKYTYATWIDCPVLCNHDPEDECGFIADAIPIWDTKGVDMVMATSVEQKPDVCKRIEAQLQTDVSMGCDLSWSICSNCTHISFTDNDWCNCLIDYKGRRHASSGRLVAEILKDVNGVELSHITEGVGADADAKNKSDGILFSPRLSRRTAKMRVKEVEAYYRHILKIR